MGPVDSLAVPWSSPGVAVINPAHRWQEGGVAPARSEPSWRLSGSLGAGVNSGPGSCEPVPCVVLDLFTGFGTTLAVARGVPATEQQAGRWCFVHALGIDPDEALRLGVQRWLSQHGSFGLRCGCALTECPCCGKLELVVDPTGSCRLGGPDHPAHRELVEIARAGLRR